jgi:hypothetical protein
MARLQARVARGYNRRRRFFGRLWQSRYRARVIDTEEYYRQVLAYVHLNPVAAGITEDPGTYVYSGHREILGLCRPHVIDRRAALSGFEGKEAKAQADSYQRWVRAVAEAKMLEIPVSELPWWEQAHHVDEIADASRHPSATLYNGQSLAEERAEMDLVDFASRFEEASGRPLDQLASRSRSPDVIRARIEFVTLALPRYGYRGCDVAALLDKHGNSVTLWLSEGLRLQQGEPEFKLRLDRLDAEISHRD